MVTAASETPSIIHHAVSYGLGADHFPPTPPQAHPTNPMLARSLARFPPSRKKKTLDAYIYHIISFIRSFRHPSIHHPLIPSHPSSPSERIRNSQPGKPSRDRPGHGPCARRRRRPRSRVACAKVEAVDVGARHGAHVHLEAPARDRRQAAACLISFSSANTSIPTQHHKPFSSQISDDPGTVQQARELTDTSRARGIDADRHPARDGRAAVHPGHDDGDAEPGAGRLGGQLGGAGVKVGVALAHGGGAVGPVVEVGGGVGEREEGVLDEGERRPLGRRGRDEARRGGAGADGAVSFWGLSALQSVRPTPLFSPS